MGWSLNTRRKGKERLVKQKGFTLIELMIVVAIIGILAAIAMPQYNRYVARTQVAEAFALVGSIKPALALYYQENGNFPQDHGVAVRHDQLGIPRRDDYRSDYVHRISVLRNGAIRVILRSEANGVNALIADRRFEMLPETGTGVITSWKCQPFGNALQRIDDQYIKSCM